MIYKTALRDCDIHKLSIIYNTPEITLRYLNQHQLINITNARDSLIRYDAKLISNQLEPSIRPKELIKRLSEEYNISISKVEKMIYGKHREYRYCSQCGRRITKESYIKYNGKCRRCAAG